MSRRLSPSAAMTSYARRRRHADALPSFASMRLFPMLISLIACRDARAARRLRFEASAGEPRPASAAAAISSYTADATSLRVTIFASFRQLSRAYTGAPLRFSGRCFAEMTISGHVRGAPRVSHAMIRLSLDSASYDKRRPPTRA